MRRFASPFRCIPLLAAGAVLAGCAGSGSKVLQDFGLQERPEDYVSGADRVRQRLPDVAKSEMTRLNAAARNGEVLYERTDALSGAYYKRAKVYGDFRPLDAQYSGRKSARAPTSYQGYIEYVYEYYESPRQSSRIEAAAELANIPTGEMGRETYRYHFGGGGVWNGAKGEPVRLR